MPPLPNPGVSHLLPGFYLIGISHFPNPGGLGLECPLSLCSPDLCPTSRLAHTAQRGAGRATSLLHLAVLVDSSYEYTANKRFMNFRKHIQQVTRQPCRLY